MVGERHWRGMGTTYYAWIGLYCYLMHPFRILLILSELNEVCEFVRNSISKDYKMHNKKKFFFFGANFISQLVFAWKALKEHEIPSRRTALGNRNATVSVLLKWCWRLTVLIKVDTLRWNTTGRKHLVKAISLVRSVCYFPNILIRSHFLEEEWVFEYLKFTLSGFRQQYLYFLCIQQ